jgi:hypothetical protein
MGARARAEEAARIRAAREAGGGRARAAKPTRTAFPIDPALRIKDPASGAFVLGSILVFLLIFLNAMAFGRGGAFTPERTPRPAPIVTPGPSVSPGPSASPGSSASPAPSGSAAPSAAPSPSTPASSAAPSPS